MKGIFNLYLSTSYLQWVDDNKNIAVVGHVVSNHSNTKYHYQMFYILFGKSLDHNINNSYSWSEKKKKNGIPVA